MNTVAPRRKPPRRRGRLSWRNPATRALVYQAVALALVAALVAWLGHNTLVNMAARGIRSGWDFLVDPAGFDIGERAIRYESVDPYWKAFLVGLLNTLRVALPGIVMATLIGTAVGIGRFASNALVRGICYVWVEMFRNVPVLVQLLFWYLLALEFLPDAYAPWKIEGVMRLSKAGLELPGDLTLSPEYLAVLFGLVFYTSAFVAEVVRAGIASVPRGQVEAALSIGLSRAQTIRGVVLPQALRVIVPPMTNQYLNLTKNSSLAVAVGYPDVVSVATTTLNQTGRAVECIAIIMAVYLTLSLLTAALMGAYNRKVAIKER